MDWRSNDTPMEFEYDNGVGNIDNSESRSPFARLASQNKAGTLDRNFGSAFKSPSASTTSSARNPTFNIPQLPQTPKGQAPVFREHINTDFSSAAESSPDAGHGADSEDTPDPKRLENVTFTRGASPNRSGKTKTPTKSPTASKRTSFFAKLKPSKGHMELMRRAHKRKMREVEREDRLITLRHGSEDPYNDESRPSSADGPDTPVKDGRSGGGKGTGTVASVLSFIHEHPRLPTILAFYGQCLFSFFILTMLGWMIWGMYSAVLQQIEVEAELLGQDARRETLSCGERYFENRCDQSGAIPPALREFCADMDHCRNQDWRAKGRAKIGAHTFAQILNSFVEPLSYKLIVLVLACLVVLVMSPYTLFSPVKRATDMHFPEQPQQPQPSQGAFFPQTPSHQMQQEWANAGGFATGFYTPQSGRQWGAVNDWGSPSKRLEGRPRSPVKQVELHKKYT